ncbi:cyclohexanone monooxygenase domain protein [Mycobacterium xenopi 4042]|uniref:Cyclohexanone monooxygenase domain protein n=1 Tax=Mycobacterium xenopi 4042 TaxID=1299334 RepID=X8DL03_MYCXE|nr:cyclohexanone monooxygenase domain protein [Mycobacterium xenopi 4042]
MTDTLFEVMTVTGVLHYRQFRRLNIAAADLAKINRFVSVRDKELRRKLTPTTTSAASGPPGPTATTAHSPNRTCICRPTRSSGSSPTVSSPQMATRPISTPLCWPRDLTCGTPTSRLSS